MNFGVMVLNGSIRTMQNYATWIQTTLLFILKLNFYEDIANDVEKNLIHKIMKSTDHCLKERIKIRFG